MISNVRTKCLLIDFVIFLLYVLFFGTIEGYHFIIVLSNFSN